MSHSTRRAFLTGLAPLAAALAAADSTPMRVGCQANAWPLREGDFPQLLDVLRQMRTLGYIGFECNIRYLRGQFDDADEARQQIEETGMRFIGAHTDLEQSASSSFAAWADAVAAMGGERIVMSARGLSLDGHFDETALRDKVNLIQRAARIGIDQGIRLAYHNHNPEFASDNAEEDELARRTDPALVDFLVDAGHAYLGGGDPALFLSEHAGRIFGFHIKTFRGKRQVPLGKGDFGFEDLAAAIRKTGWKGWLIDEEGGGPKPADTAAVGPDREYIKRIFGL